jgi:hypothetical protein
MKCPHCGNQRTFRQAVTVVISATAVFDGDGHFMYYSGFLTHVATDENILEKRGDLTCEECEQTFTIAEAS